MTVEPLVKEILSQEARDEIVQEWHDLQRDSTKGLYEIATSIS